MFALTILVVLAAYVGIAWMVIKRLPSRRAKWIVVAIFVLIPTWDIVPGYVYFYTLCATEGGQKIYKTVKLPPEYFLKAGDPDRSRADVGGTFPKAVGGELNWEKLSELYLNQSEFDRNYSKLFHITKVHSYVQDKQTKEILGAATS